MQMVHMNGNDDADSRGVISVLVRRTRNLQAAAACSALYGLPSSLSSQRGRADLRAMPSCAGPAVRARGRRRSCAAVAPGLFADWLQF